MGRRISKEFLHPSILEGVNDKIGNLDELETNAKDNMVQAVNELLDKLGNSEAEAEMAEGKELIANAIGEPLVAEDSFQDMSNDINGLLSTFKTNMMNNGIVVNSGDKFKSLIDKIVTMVEEGEGKGIQFAEGECDVSVYDNTSNVTSNYVYDPTNGVISYGTTLDFTPTAIFLCVPKLFWGFNDSQIVCNAVIGSLYNNSSSKAATLGAYNRSSNNNGVSAEGIVEAYITNVTNSSFKLYVSPYSGMYRGINCKCQWYAIGVGEEDTTLRDSLASILEEEGVDVTEEDDMASLITKVDEEFENMNNKISSGKKITTGKSTLNVYGGYTNELITREITTSLDYTPSHIFVNIPSIQCIETSDSVNITVDSNIANSADNCCLVRFNWHETWETYTFQVRFYITDITPTSFKLNIKCYNAYDYDIDIIGEMTWYAIE